MWRYLLNAQNLAYRQEAYQISTYAHQFINVHLIRSGERYLLIDAGLPDDQQGLLKFLQEERVDPAQIEYLILTHAHPDHAGNAAWLQQEYGIRIIAGRGDSTIIQNQGADPDLCVYKWPG